MLKLLVDRHIVVALQQLRTARIPAARRKLIQQLLQSSLQKIRDNTPVQTGRAQAAWEAAHRQLLSESTTSNAGSTTEGTATQTNDQQTTTAEATNAVPYIVFLEYGTRRQRPVAMVRRALHEIRPQISQLFRLDESAQ